MLTIYDITFEPVYGTSTVIEYKRQGDSVWIKPTSAPNPTSLNHYTLALDSGFDYYVRVTATGGNCPDESAIISVSTPVESPHFFFSASGLVHVIHDAFRIQSSYPFTVDWGDSTVDVFPGSGAVQTPTHLYDGGAYTGNIVIHTSDLSGIGQFSIGGGLRTDVNPINGGLSILTSEVNKLTNLVTLATGESMFVDGIISDFPSTVQTILIGDTNLSGAIVNIPRTATYVNITGANALSGPVTDLPPAIYFLILFGLNTLTGDVVGLPRSIIVLYLEGNNSLSGNVSNLPPNLTDLECKGTNTLTGDVNGLPKSITNVVNITGNNTLSGNISNLPPGLRNITLIGNNTVSGNIANLPFPIVFVQVGGLNSLTGSVSSMPPAIQYCNLFGSACLISGYTAGRIWPSSMNSINLVPGLGGFTSFQVLAMIREHWNLQSNVTFSLRMMKK